MKFNDIQKEGRLSDSILIEIDALPPKEVIRQKTINFV
jgi:hypothetical protein